MAGKRNQLQDDRERSEWRAWFQWIVNNPNASETEIAVRKPNRFDASLYKTDAATNDPWLKMCQRSEFKRDLKSEWETMFDRVRRGI